MLFFSHNLLHGLFFTSDFIHNSLRSHFNIEHVMHVFVFSYVIFLGFFLAFRKLLFCLFFVWLMYFHVQLINVFSRVTCNPILSTRGHVVLTWAISGRMEQFFMSSHFTHVKCLWVFRYGHYEAIHLDITRVHLLLGHKTEMCPLTLFMTSS